MNGLRSRLEGIEGVESIELELGDTGLEGITVRLREGADEIEVLEGVRRLLVAYGTRPLGVGQANASEATIEAPPRPALAPDMDEIDMTAAAIESNGTDLLASEQDVAAATPVDEDATLSVTPAGDHSVARVVYRRGDRTITRQVPSSARAIVQAVLDVTCEAMAREPISVIGINVSSIEGTRVLTVIAGNEGDTPRVSTVSIFDEDWSAALLDVATQILSERPKQG